MDIEYQWNNNCQEIPEVAEESPVQIAYCLTQIPLSVHRQSPAQSVVTFWKVRRKSNFGQIGIDYTYGQLPVYIHGISVDIQTPNTLETDRPQHESLRQCCRPRVYFCRLRLTVFSPSQGKIRLAFKKRYYFKFLIFKNLHILRKMKLRKLASFLAEIKLGSLRCGTDLSRLQVFAIV